jgi:hypothetical protein
MRRCLLQRIEGTRWVFLGPVGTDGMFPRGAGGDGRWGQTGCFHGTSQRGSLPSAGNVPSVPIHLKTLRVLPETPTTPVLEREECGWLC